MSIVQNNVEMGVCGVSPQNVQEEFGSTFPKVDFNASFSVTELLTKTLENVAKDLAMRCIKECAVRHGFDASEEFRILGLENIVLIKKQMTKKGKSEKKSKRPVISEEEKAAKKAAKVLEREEKKAAKKAEQAAKKAEKGTKSKGRPKKAIGVIEAENVDDLFAKLTAEPVEEEQIIIIEEPIVKSKKVVLTEEEKAIKKAALEAERLAKKAEKEAKEAVEKAQREAKRQQEKAEREAAKALEKAEKEAAKALAKASKAKKVDVVVPQSVVVAAQPVAVAPQSVSVSGITIGNVKYMKSKTNILYDPKTKEAVGMWDPVNKVIIPLPEEEEEEVEEEEEEEVEEEVYEDDN